MFYVALPPDDQSGASSDQNANNEADLHTVKRELDVSRSSQLCHMRTSLGVVMATGTPSASQGSRYADINQANLVATAGAFSAKELARVTRLSVCPTGLPPASGTIASALSFDSWPAKQPVNRSGSFSFADEPTPVLKRSPYYQPSPHTPVTTCSPPPFNGSAASASSANASNSYYGPRVAQSYSFASRVDDDEHDNSHSSATDPHTDENDSCGNEESKRKRRHDAADHSSFAKRVRRESSHLNSVNAAANAAVNVNVAYAPPPAQQQPNNTTTYNTAYGNAWQFAPDVKPNVLNGTLRICTFFSFTVLLYVYLIRSIHCL